MHAIRDAAVQTCRTTRRASLVWPLFRQALYLSTHLFVYEACDHSNVGSTASENASDCTAQVISTVSRRLGTLYSTDFPTTTGEKKPSTSSIAVNRASKSVMAREASSSSSSRFLPFRRHHVKAAPSLLNRQGMVIILVAIILTVCFHSKRVTRMLMQMPSTRPNLPAQSPNGRLGKTGLQSFSYAATSRTLMPFFRLMSPRHAWGSMLGRGQRGKKRSDLFFPTRPS